MRTHASNCSSIATKLRLCTPPFRRGCPVRCRSRPQGKRQNHARRARRCSEQRCSHQQQHQQLTLLQEPQAAHLAPIISKICAPQRCAAPARSHSRSQPPHSTDAAPTQRRRFFRRFTQLCRRDRIQADSRRAHAFVSEAATASIASATRRCTARIVATHPRQSRSTAPQNRAQRSIALTLLSAASKSQPRQAPCSRRPSQCAAVNAAHSQVRHGKAPAATAHTASRCRAAL